MIKAFYEKNQLYLAGILFSMEICCGNSLNSIAEHVMVGLYDGIVRKPRVADVLLELHHLGDVISSIYLIIPKCVHFNTRYKWPLGIRTGGQLFDNAVNVAHHAARIRLFQLCFIPANICHVLNKHKTHRYRRCTDSHNNLRTQRPYNIRMFNGLVGDKEV